MKNARKKTLVKSTPGVYFINILCVPFCRYFGAKKSLSQNLTREKLHKVLLYKKCACKMLMKLTPGVYYCGLHLVSVSKLMVWA